MGDTMWNIKTFTSKESMTKWIESNIDKYQITEIFVNNGYGVEYRPLRKVY